MSNLAYNEIVTIFYSKVKFTSLLGKYEDPSDRHKLNSYRNKVNSLELSRARVRISGSTVLPGPTVQSSGQDSPK